MNLPFPAAVIDSVIAAGVEEFVICAGARNSALVVVLAGLGSGVRLWQHFDERAAAFFALGRMRTTVLPVAVVTTSGTAVAELLPAIIEAHYQGLPLVALTADRPPEYRGSGAPQAIEQAGIFGIYAQAFDLTANASGLPELPAVSSCRGPVHLNVCLEELRPDQLHPLREAATGLRERWTSRALPGTLRSGESRPGAWVPEFPSPPPTLPSGGGLVIAGELLDPEIPGAAAALTASGSLVFAEAASGLRDLPAIQDRLIRCGDATLRHLPLRRVWRIGGVPSVRLWRDFEDRPDIEVHCFSRSGHSGLARNCRHPDSTEFPSPELSLPEDEMLARDAALYHQLESLLAIHTSSEPALLRQLSRLIPRNAVVFTGNSLAIREWNLCAEYGRGHRVHVLRGANGIDGNLSAFLGIAADEPEAWCITGDLTALYDLSAPWMLDQLSRGNRRFVVIQNGGGKIFSRLPSLRGLSPREQSLMENPHSISLKPWAEMWGMSHLSGGVECLANPDALAAHSGSAVIELYPDSFITEKFWLEWAAAERNIWS